MVWTRRGRIRYNNEFPMFRGELLARGVLAGQAITDSDKIGHET
jgi:hypothetical protein